MNFSSLFKKSSGPNAVDGIVMSDEQLSKIAAPLSQIEIANMNVRLVGLTSQMI